MAINDQSYASLLEQLGIAAYDQNKAARPVWLDAASGGYFDFDNRQNAQIGDGEGQSYASYDENTGHWIESGTNRPIVADDTGFYYGDTYRQEASDAYNAYLKSVDPKLARYSIGPGDIRGRTEATRKGAYDYVMSSLLSGKEVPLNEWLAANYESNEIIPDNPVSQQIASQYSSLYGSKPTGQLLKGIGANLGLTEDEVNKVAGAVAANKYGDNFAQGKSGWNAGKSIAAQDWTDALIQYAEGKGITVPDAAKTSITEQTNKINDWFQKMRRVESHSGGMLSGFVNDVLPIIAPALGPWGAVANAVVQGSKGNIAGAALNLAGAGGAFGDSFGAANAAQLAKDGVGFGQIVDTLVQEGSSTIGAYANAANGVFSSATGLPTGVLPGAIKGAVSAKDPLTGLLTGGVSGGVNQYIGENLDAPGAVKSGLQGAVSGAANAIGNGTSVGTGAAAGLASGATAGAMNDLGAGSFSGFLAPLVGNAVAAGMSGSSQQGQSAQNAATGSTATGDTPDTGGTGTTPSVSQMSFGNFISSAFDKDFNQRNRDWRTGRNWL